MPSRYTDVLWDNTSSDLVKRESNQYVVIGGGGGGGVSDGTYGDVVVSGGGTVWTVTIPESQVTSLVADLGVLTAADAVLTASLATKVPSTRTISTTPPLAGGGDLSANRTLSVATFTGAGTTGVVPDPVASTGLFLKDDGTWATPAGGGTPTSRLVNTTAPLTGGGDLTADRTLGIADFVASGASAARGAVPVPPGVAGTALFLREDATWANPDTDLLVNSTTLATTTSTTTGVATPMTIAFPSAGTWIYYGESTHNCSIATSGLRCSVQATGGLTASEVSLWTIAYTLAGGNPSGVFGFATWTTVTNSNASRSPFTFGGRIVVTAPGTLTLWIRSESAGATSNLYGGTMIARRIA